MLPKENRALVQGVNMVKRHTKPTQQDAWAASSRRRRRSTCRTWRIVDPQTGKPTRVGFRVLEDGRKVRFAKRSGESHR